MIVNSNNQILVRNMNLFSGLKFNGTNQYLTAPYPEEVDLLSADYNRTVAFWININTVGVTNRNVFFFTRNGVGCVRETIAITPTNKIFYTAQAASGGGSVERWEIETSNSVSTNKNIHCCFTKNGIDANDGHIFINGVEVSKTIKHNSLLLTSDINLGESGLYRIGSNLDTQHLGCIMSDFKIFNSALSENGVKKIYKAEGRTPKGLTPVLDLLFNQLNSKVAYDKSGNGYDFDLINYTDTEVGIPDQSTNTAWVNAYPPYNPFV